MKSLLTLTLLFLLAGCASRTSVPEPTTVLFEPAVYRSDPTPVPGFLWHPSDNGPHPALVLVHGDFGPTRWVKGQGRRLARKGYVVLAVDLYRGQVVTDVMDAHILDRGLPEEQVAADLKAAVNYLTRLPDVRADALGILGWDSGGGHALDAALRDERLRAAVVCYGRLTTDPALLAPLHASVLGIFAGRDAGISSETIDEFRTAMARAGKRVAGLHVYPDCGHGFLDPSSADPAGPAPAEAVADAWSRIEAYLAAELSP
jgi:carboxymethylenebutenolidase